MHVLLRIRGPRGPVAAAALIGACVAACPGSALAAAARAIPVAAASGDANSLALGRAVLEQSAGNLRGVVENLEALDFSREGAFAEADRAAFLLAQAHLKLGDHARFTALARQVGRWSRTSVYTRWIAWQLALETASPDAADSLAPAETGSARFATADLLAASVLLQRGDAAGALGAIAAIERRGELPPLALYLRARALAATGGDERAAWTGLAATDTATALGRDLVGAARVRLGTLALAAGEDASALLAGVPAGSRWQAEATHLRGLLALEHGRRAEAESLLALVAADSSYPARRDAQLALAGRALETGHWSDALESYRGLDGDVLRRREALERMLAGNAFDACWNAWEAGDPAEDAFGLDGRTAQDAARRLAARSLDLTAHPADDVPALRPSPRSADPGVLPPTAAEWQAVSASGRRLDEALAERERTRWSAAREAEALADRQRYLAGGLAETERLASRLRLQAALLDSLRGQLDATHARLAAVRDEAIRRVAARTEALLAECAKNATWIDAMKLFHVEGPNRQRPPRLAPGTPQPSAALAEEQALGLAIRHATESLAAQAPGLITRSYDQAWGPRLLDRALAMRDDAHESLAWAQGLGASVDSARLAAATSDELRRLQGRLAAFERASDSLRRSHDALRALVARAAIGRTLAALADEREAIDYGLAASAYARSVKLMAPDSADAAGTRAARVAPADTAGGDEALDDPETIAQRTEAIARLRAFLASHPNSEARGEMRFRLADVLLVEARQHFREQMAAFVRAQSQPGGPPVALPVLAHDEAFALYETILREDPGFEHLDAVRFNAGMILADAGDPRAEAFFADLVEKHPASSYVQESLLRMGDMRFADKRWAECIALYDRAAAGADPTLTAMALYKKGWAQFDQERFGDAADAFRAVLDVYARADRADIHVDLERESEQYFVQSLARAGGAAAFAAYFDQLGKRPYEGRVLRSLGQHFRRYSLFAEAAATEELALQRWPLDPDALPSAQRLVETWQRADRAGELRAARLAVAERFEPNSAWSAAQASDSVRAAGAAFARGSYLAVAAQVHRSAREKGAKDDWREALKLYEKVRTHWPDDPEAATLELAAGEASAALGDWPGALAHHGQAAKLGRDSVAVNAMWLRVAVTDEWYESTRATGARGARTGLGRDSLAREVLARGDELLKQQPGHPKAADLRWRQANLALAHGWFDRAAGDFGALAERHPADARASDAAALRGDALFRQQKFAEASRAYEEAIPVARRAGRDSLARRAEAALPVCALREAEAAVAADSSDHARHAVLFDRVATRWPQYEYAPLAQYRAGLAHLRAGHERDAVLAMEALVRTFPRSEYVRDARVQIARTWEKENEPAKAAAAWVEFTRAYPADSSTAGAWLKAADLYEKASMLPQADELRLAYLQRYPKDVEGAMEILEAFARRELATVTPEHPVSTLLAKPKAARGAATAPPSRLADYLQRAAAHPKLASRALIAQVRFLEGEEAFAPYAATKLTQPLPASIALRQKRLDDVLARYKRCVELGDALWAHAATYRLGQSLVSFGEALEQSERPSDLAGNDLRAYEDVIFQQARVFRDRGEGVWTELLKQSAGSEPKPDDWLVRAQNSLWTALGDRFAFRAEMDWPRIEAKEPEKPTDTEETPDSSAARVKDRSKARAARATQEDPSR